MLKSAEIVDKISKSQIYRDYEAAFNQATQLPLAFRPHESGSPPCAPRRRKCVLRVDGQDQP